MSTATATHWKRVKDPTEGEVCFFCNSETDDIADSGLEVSGTRAYVCKGCAEKLAKLFRLGSSATKAAIEEQERERAFLEKQQPDFPLVCEAVLHRHSEIPLTFIAFDVLSVEGTGVIRQPYRERRRILEALRLSGPRWRSPEAFEDGHALRNAVCEHELEGVVAKRLHEPYVPGERSWVKVKNRAYWRWELEREGAIRSRRTPSLAS